MKWGSLCICVVCVRWGGAGAPAKNSQAGVVALPVWCGVRSYVVLLCRLDLDRNLLTGTIPADWPDVSALKNVSILLVSNDLSGKQPHSA